MWREETDLPAVRCPLIVTVGDYYKGVREEVDFGDLDGFHLTSGYGKTPTVARVP